MAAVGRTVEDMEEEIVETKANVGASLDRSLAALQETVQTGNETQVQLKENNEKLDGVNKGVSTTKQELEVADNKLKHGFGFYATCMPCCCCGPSKEQEEARKQREAEAAKKKKEKEEQDAEQREFERAYRKQQQQARGATATATNGQRGLGGGGGPSHMSMGRGDTNGGKGAPGAGGGGGGVTEEFGGQLSAIDSLLDDLAQQSKDISAQVAENAVGIARTEAELGKLNKATTEGTSHVNALVT